MRILSSNQIGNLKYRVDLICDTLQKRYKSYTAKEIGEEIAKNLLELGNKLYPNVEHLRIELFKQAIDKNLINKDNIKSLKLNNIESNDLLLDFLTYAKRRIKINEPDILKLTKDRYYSRYESLADLLKNKKPEDVFSQDSMKQINVIFNNNIQEFKALDILSYFDVKGRVEDFHSMLQESFKQNIRNEFKPSKDQLLISEEELDKISKLIGDESVKDQFFKVGDLCRYIKEKVGELPELNENFTINFENIEYIDPKTQKKIQEASQQAFNQNDRDNDIIGFLRLIIDPNDADNLVITDSNKGKLLQFFRQSKASISQLLQKEGGLDKFITTLSTISDGCSANIGSQFHIALYDCLLQDERDAALHQILSQDIIPAILNRGRDRIGSQSNPLDNDKVTECHYSPEALFDKIAKVFYDQREKKIGRNATNLIQDEYGDKAHEIIDLLMADGNSNFDQNAAQIAAYLTLSHSGLIPIDRLNSIFDSNISPGLKNNKELIQKLKKATPESPDVNPILDRRQDEAGKGPCCTIS